MDFPLLADKLSVLPVENLALQTYLLTTGHHQEEELTKLIHNIISMQSKEALTLLIIQAIPLII